MASNLTVREIDGRFWVMAVNSEGRIIATHKKESYKTAAEALAGLHELEQEPYYVFPKLDRS